MLRVSWRLCYQCCTDSIVHEPCLFSIYLSVLGKCMVATYRHAYTPNQHCRVMFTTWLELIHLLVRSKPISSESLQVQGRRRPASIVFIDGDCLVLDWFSR